MTLRSGADRDRNETGLPRVGEPAVTAGVTQGMRAWMLVLVLAFAAACTAAGTPAPSQTPAPSNLTDAQLKYRLLDGFGRLLFCDPDYYPIARADEQVLAHDRLPGIQADAATFSAIVDHLHIAPSG
jgi:hypothetical protein